eukprot:191451_1
MASATDVTEVKQNSNNEAEQCYITPFCIDTKPFPDRFEESISKLPQYTHHTNFYHEKVFVGEKDKRKIYDTSTVDFNSRIGRLRMIFEDMGNCYSGTATVFYNNSKTKRVYAITCGHNLIHYNHLEDRVHLLKHIWFDRRKTNDRILWKSSISKHKYEIDSVWIHPKYDAKESVSAFDLGIVSFIDSDNFFTRNVNHMNKLKLGGCNYVAGNSRKCDKVSRNFDQYDFYPFEGFSLMGFPGEKNGQLWGETVMKDSRSIAKFQTKVMKQFEKKGGDMLKYRVHTSHGQSGASVVLTSRTNYFLCRDRIYSDHNQNKLHAHIYSDHNQMIYGIHTGGDSTTLNWGVKINQNHKEWILSCVTSVEINRKRHEILALFEFCSAEFHSPFKTVNKIQQIYNCIGELCNHCQTRHINLRRSYEKKMINRLKSVNRSKRMFALNMNFFKQWQDFAYGKTDVIPDKIDNSVINNGCDIVKAECVVNVDYCLVDNRTWKFLVQFYNGGSEIYKQWSVSVTEPHKLKIGDHIDYSSSVATGYFGVGTIVEKQGTRVKIYAPERAPESVRVAGKNMYQRYLFEWSDLAKELHKFADVSSVSARPAHRLMNVKTKDWVDIQSKSGWITGKIADCCSRSGQIYVVHKEGHSWVHLDDAETIAKFGTKSDGCKSMFIRLMY